MPTITYNPITREWQCPIDDEGTLLISQSKSDLEEALDKLENLIRERDSQ
jgi:hypothetical protein